MSATGLPPGQCLIHGLHDGQVCPSCAIAAGIMWGFFPPPANPQDSLSGAPVPVEEEQ